MPTSKHRKKHKAKSKQRRNEIAQKKSAQNKVMRRYQEQIEAINQQYKEHIANGGKAEDFQPLQELLKGMPIADKVTDKDTDKPLNDDDDGAVYGKYEPENTVEEIKNEEVTE